MRDRRQRRGKIKHNPDPILSCLKKGGGLGWQLALSGRLVPAWAPVSRRRKPFIPFVYLITAVRMDLLLDATLTQELASPLPRFHRIVQCQ